MTEQPNRPDDTILDALDLVAAAFFRSHGSMRIEPDEQEHAAQYLAAALPAADAIGQPFTPERTERELNWYRRAAWWDLMNAYANRRSTEKNG